MGANCDPERKLPNQNFQTFSRSSGNTISLLKHWSNNYFSLRNCFSPIGGAFEKWCYCEKLSTYFLRCLTSATRNFCHLEASLKQSVLCCWFNDGKKVDRALKLAPAEQEALIEENDFSPAVDPLSKNCRDQKKQCVLFFSANTVYHGHENPLKIKLPRVSSTSRW